MLLEELFEAPRTYRNISSQSQNPENKNSIIKDVNFGNYNEVSRKNFARFLELHQNYKSKRDMSQEGLELATIYYDDTGIKAFKVTGGSGRSAGGMYYILKGL